ncbi:class I SAM-dependent DNA methyltransferase [Aureimonas psammosilenae]|uniref:class I SAM-dependent DNA methyltransferase n=1 Tax=Aureimonas psammosilenae TaxID=2495496 RepID=UPI002E258121
MHVETFIARWTSREGGAERANYQMFLSELCDTIGVERPQPAGADRERNDYVFERAVRPRGEGSGAPRRIDLYKRNAFILEAKQMRLPGHAKALSGQGTIPLFGEPEELGRRSIARGWDVMMQNARKQAEAYVFLLDADHAAPPFIIACDVGHCLELYADFTGTGRAYHQFPDRQNFRIYMEDLKKDEVRQRLATVWTDPHSLDPSRIATRVTRGIAQRLAAVSRRLEADYPPESVAHFLMRCIFTMFAEGVGLLPRGGFTDLLANCTTDPASFAPLVADLWRSMDEPAYEKRYCVAIRARLRHFNGNLFKNAEVFALEREEIGELLEASRLDWRMVDPAIFGTLLEQALDPTERRRLGAHYTPRSYVERLVNVAVMEPLQTDWQAARMVAEAATRNGDGKKAVAVIRDFHLKLCGTRVLDPACGTGNFLYVALEMMKKLEGEVLETLAELGQAENMGLDRETVDPHQFLGLELNPRAAAIAELVVWIGYLQQHYKTRSGHPSEPILRAFQNINGGQREGFDAVLEWDGGASKPRRPDWPDAEFIVGNPPFIGGKDLRSRLGSSYVEALWCAHPQMNESANYVMYWWDRAAELLTSVDTRLRRFGFVTTNAITQPFQRSVIERRLNAKEPIHLRFAVPNHPWTKVTSDPAAVRVAMTVAEKGGGGGVLWKVSSERKLDTDEPEIDFVRQEGLINSNLSIGTDVTKTRPLLANDGLSSPGVKLHGNGFVVTPSQALHLGLWQRPGLENHLRPYRNGRDLTGRPRNVMAVDLFGLSAESVRRTYPEVYQYLLEAVRTPREKQAAKSPTTDALSYLENWWLFGKPRSELRPALEGLPRYIATVETAKHRVFQFLDASILADNMLVVVADDDAARLATLSSRINLVWASRRGGLLEDRPRYTKSTCFDPFPFPTLSGPLEAQLRDAGEELDATCKRVLADHPDLTLTGLYNVLEKLRANLSLSEREEDAKRRGLVLILKELHDTIDRLAAEAYG